MNSALRSHVETVRHMNKFLEEDNSYDTNKPFFIFIFGLGCDQNRQNRQEQERTYYSNIIRNYGGSTNNILFICRQMKKILVDIRRLSMSGCNANILNNTLSSIYMDTHLVVQ